MKEAITEFSFIVAAKRGNKRGVRKEEKYEQ